MAKTSVIEAVTAPASSTRGFLHAVYRAALPPPARTPNFMSGVIRWHRKAIGSWWRAPGAGRQALPAPARLKKGEAFAQAAAGPGAGTAAARRCVNATVDLPAARKPRKAARDAGRAAPACVTAGGTLIPVGRAARGRPSCPGRRKRHGVDRQVTASPHGDVRRVCGALPGSVRGKRAGRVRGVPGEPEAAGPAVLAGSGCRGSGHARLPYTKRKGGKVPDSEREASRARARLRAPGERANARPMSRGIPRKARC